MRLDRFLCEMNIGTRSQVKALIRQGAVRVNDIPVKNADRKINPDLDQVFYKGQRLQYRRYVYYMMNKPAGVVSATVDGVSDTVLSLLEENQRKNVFPVGRLDKDTTGLLLLTNDGALAHRLLAPERHVDKVYQVTLEYPLSEADICRLEEGVDIGDETFTGPALVKVLDRYLILLTIQEGRYHQVKRMMFAVGNGVVKLGRVAFGGLHLDPALAEGQYRELTPKEIELLSGAGQPKK